MGSQLGGLINGLWGDAGQNFVDLQGGNDAVFGTKPKVADFIPTNFSDEQQKALQDNLDAAGGVTALLDKLIPNYEDILKQGSDNTLSLLKGEIPPDVAAQIQRNAAEASSAGGYSGTGMAKARTARDLGRTSLDMIGLGQNSAQLWNSIATGDAAPFMVTTPMQEAEATRNNAGTQATQQFKFNVAAAPDPGAAGVFNLDAALGSQMLSMGMGAAMGAMGGGGGSRYPVAGADQPWYQQQSLGGSYANTSNYSSNGPFNEAGSGGTWGWGGYG